MSATQVASGAIGGLRGPGGELDTAAAEAAITPYTTRAEAAATEAAQSASSIKATQDSLYDTPASIGGNAATVAITPPQTGFAGFIDVGTEVALDGDLSALVIGDTIATHDTDTATFWIVARPLAISGSANPNLNSSPDVSPAVAGDVVFGPYTYTPAQLGLTAGVSGTAVVPLPLLTQSNFAGCSIGFIAHFQDASAANVGWSMGGMALGSEVNQRKIGWRSNPATTVISGGSHIAFSLQARVRLSLADTADDVATLSEAANEIFETIYGVEDALWVVDGDENIVTRVPIEAGDAPASEADLLALAARVNSVVTADGAPTVAVLNRENLGRLHMTLMQLLNGVSAQAIINTCLDSWTEGSSYYFTTFAAKMKAKYGDAGAGYLRCTFTGSGVTSASVGAGPWTNGNQPGAGGIGTLPPGVAYRFYGNPTSYPDIVGGTTVAPPFYDMNAVGLHASGDAMEIDIPAMPAGSAATLHWANLAGGAASIRYTLDGGAHWTAVDTTAAALVSEVTALDLSHYAFGSAATLRVEWVSGGSTLIGGANMKSNANGVRFNRLGHSGARVDQVHAVGQAALANHMADLGATATLACEGTNSKSSGVVPSVWAGYWKDMFDWERAVLPNVEQCLICVPENDRVTTYTMPAMTNAARAMAITRRMALLDLQNYAGDPNYPASYMDLYNVDAGVAYHQHPAPTRFGLQIVAAYLDLVTPYRGA